MKSIKFEHDVAETIRRGSKTSTWRIFDDKDIMVGDKLVLIDKVDPSDRNTWTEIGVAEVMHVYEKRFDQITADDTIGHEAFVSVEEMRHTYEMYYKTSIQDDTLVKIIHFRLLKDVTVFDTNALHRGLRLFADGGSRGNPGPSATGFVLLDSENNVVKKYGEYIGITTNNQAEYQALKQGLEAAKSMHVYTLDIYLDSLLVVNQMKGVFKIRNRDLWPIHQSIIELLSQFRTVTFTHIPRELNRLADAEVNRVLDERMSV